MGSAKLVYTHIKSRAEVSPEVEPFPCILDNTREHYIYSYHVGTYVGSSEEVKVES